MDNVNFTPVPSAKHGSISKAPKPASLKTGGGTIIPKTAKFPEAPPVPAVIRRFLPDLHRLLTEFLQIPLKLTAKYRGLIKRSFLFFQKKLSTGMTMKEFLITPEDLKNGKTAVAAKLKRYFINFESGGEDGLREKLSRLIRKDANHSALASRLEESLIADQVINLLSDRFAFFHLPLIDEKAPQVLYDKIKKDVTIYLDLSRLGRLTIRVAKNRKVTFFTANNSVFNFLSEQSASASSFHMNVKLIPGEHRENFFNADPSSLMNLYFQSPGRGFETKG